MPRLRLLVAASVLVLAGCAANPANPKDPYEPYNRAMYSFNDKADRYVLKPVAQGYRAVTPQPARTAVGNFFDNLRDVYSIASNALRGEGEKTLNDIMRVALNSTFGLFGLIDIATPAGLKNNKNTLGDTFASWGWQNSNYLVLPLLGPSTVRDGTGTVITLAAPGPAQSVYHNSREAVAYYGMTGISTRERLLDLDESLREAALDPYVYMRDGFLQLRASQLGQPNPTQQDEINIDDLISSPNGKADSSVPATQAAPARDASAAQ